MEVEIELPLSIFKYCGSNSVLCCTENLIERTENKQMCVGGRNTALVTSGAAAPWRSPQSFPWCISLWCSKASVCRALCGVPPQAILLLQKALPAAWWDTKGWE